MKFLTDLRSNLFRCAINASSSLSLFLQTKQNAMQVSLSKRSRVVATPHGTTLYFSRRAATPHGTTLPTPPLSSAALPIQRMMQLLRRLSEICNFPGVIVNGTVISEFVTQYIGYTFGSSQQYAGVGLKLSISLEAPGSMQIYVWDLKKDCMFRFGS